MITRIAWIVVGLLLLPLSSVAADGDDPVTRRVGYLQEELSLDQDQADRIAAVLEKLSSMGGDGTATRGSGGGHRGQGKASGGRGADSQVDSRMQQAHLSLVQVLDDEQAGRYDELMEREREWWLDPQLLRMDALLALSPDQCRQLFPILRRSRIRLRGLREAAMNGDRDAQRKMRKELEETNEVVMEFLDDTQREIWKKHLDEQKKLMEAGRGMGGRAGGRGGGMGGGPRY